MLFVMRAIWKWILVLGACGVCGSALADPPKGTVTVYQMSKVAADQLLSGISKEVSDPELHQQVLALVKAGKAKAAKQPTQEAQHRQNIRGGESFHVEMWWQSEENSGEVKIRYALTRANQPGASRLLAQVMAKRGETVLLGCFDDADQGLKGQTWMAFVALE